MNVSYECLFILKENKRIKEKKKVILYKELKIYIVFDMNIMNDYVP
jgi:hypothetical protein